MTANGQVLYVSPADQVRAKLDDPRVAAALNDLLEHADLLAILVSGLDGLVRRSDEISDSVTSAIGEFKGEVNTPLKSVDLAGLAGTFATLSGKVIEATPALNSLLGSSLVDPRAARCSGNSVRHSSRRSLPPRAIPRARRILRNPQIGQGPRCGPRPRVPAAGGQGIR